MIAPAADRSRRLASALAAVALTQAPTPLVMLGLWGLGLLPFALAGTGLRIGTGWAPARCVASAATALLACGATAAVALLLGQFLPAST